MSRLSPLAAPGSGTAKEDKKKEKSKSSSAPLHVPDTVRDADLSTRLSPGSLPRLTTRDATELALVLTPTSSDPISMSWAFIAPSRLLRGTKLLSPHHKGAGSPHVRVGGPDLWIQMRFV